MLTVTQFKLWIKLLRSGKYKKTRGQLSSHHGTYCPLGLLAVEVLNLHLNHDCTVATKKKGDSWEDQFSPIPITFIKADKQEVINNWNDDEELTFLEMADRLERNRDEFTRNQAGFYARYEKYKPKKKLKETV